MATASLCSVLQTLHNDAVAIAVRRRGVSRIARFAHTTRTPKTGVCMARAKRAVCEPLWRWTTIAT
eukprot:4349827-Lingulodinium_polyedra.AAC.1